MSAGGMIQSRYGVERRGRKNGGRVRQNTVKRETVVGAVEACDDGGGERRVGRAVGRARVRVSDVAVGRVRGGGGSAVKPVAGKGWARVMGARRKRGSGPV